MSRSLLVATLLLAACGVDPSEDERPRTMHYIANVILAPSCGNAQCHSSQRQEKNRAFDTVERACESLVYDVVAGDHEASFLYQVLVRPIKRMPYDQPMANVDRDLIVDWIDLGAPGLPATIEGCP